MVYTFCVGGEYGQTQELTDDKTRHTGDRSKKEVDGALVKGSKQVLVAIPGDSDCQKLVKIVARGVKKRASPVEARTKTGQGAGIADKYSVIVQG